MNFYAMTFSIFVVLNAIGNIPLFLGILAKYDMHRQRKIIIREMLIALLILFIFNFFGDYILGLLGISEPIIGAAGGILLFIIALGMIFPKTENKTLPNHEPFIVPLATPLVAGPGVLATIMVYSKQLENDWYLMAMILVAWLATFLILFAATNIKYFLGEKGLAACEKLGGMLILLIAIRMFATSVITLIKQTF